jgi:outer membrane receptor protein involved in Fe transport
MNKRTLLGSTALRSFAACGLALVAAAPAYAQDAPPAEQQADQQATPDEPATLTSEPEVESGENATTKQEIVVTGSRIRRPNLESIVPITSIGGEEFFQSAKTSVGDTLNDLPQLRSTFSQQNPGLGIGIAGLNLVDLRGLGTIRTLVLVNGRRHVAADILNNAVSPDINSIPNDLIERVDIVTGGNSAVYGSDAIAGVVNFILRRDFDGLQVRGQAGVNERGFGGNQYVSTMFGKNFGGGRGNITAHAEYSKQDRIFMSQLPWFDKVSGLFVVDTDPSGSDGNPDRIFLTDVRSSTINRFGLIPITQQPNVAPCGLGINGVAYNCTLLFNPDGTLVPQTGIRFGSGPNPGFVGGNGQTGREATLLPMYPEQRRINLNLLAHYEFSPALEVFAEAKWAKNHVEGNNAGPTGIQGIVGQFDTRQRIRLDNPFLTDAQQTQIANAILASGCIPSLNTICPVGGNLTAQNIADIQAGSFRVPIARNLVDLGNRDEIFDRKTYRIVGGVRGTFNDDWSYELSLNYGKFKEHIGTRGFLNRQRFLLSIDAGVNPANGQIQCRAQFDPAARAAAAAFGGATLAALDADIAACVPYNPIGATDNSAAVNYFKSDAVKHAMLSQFVASGFVSGDTSQVFELPGGPIRFALGAEYRKEKAFYHDDPFVLTGGTNNVVIGDFDPDPFEVKEAFGELQIPILKDMPFFEELTVSGAARVAKYQGGTGTVWAYNAGGEWAPVRDIRFRANYGRAVRAPNFSETGFPIVPNFAPNFSDPCRPGAIGSGSATRAANCATDLGPLLASQPDILISLPVLSGSNPNLQAEKSDSLTIGGVLQPRFLPGFSLSVDYYKITVNDVISSPSAQTIANSCYDQPTLNNPFCTAFQRWRGPGTGPFGEQPGQILGNTLLQAPLNFAKRERRGIDFEGAYRARLGANARIDSHLIYVHTLKVSDFENPADPTFENRILGELGDPEDEFRWDNDLTLGVFTFGYRMHFIGRMWTGAFEDFNSLQGRPPENPDFSSPKRTPPITYHDIRFEWNMKNALGIPGIGNGGSDFKFYVGVDNILNQKPPLGISGTGSLNNDRVGQASGITALYDPFGRKYYAGFRARF